MEESNSKIFRIQDRDRPMFVIASDWAQAIKAWKQLVADENAEAVDEVEDPSGIELIALGDEWFSADDALFLQR